MKKRRIGIDARLLYQTGVGVYLRNLIYELSKLPQENIRYVIFAKQSEWVEFIKDYEVGLSDFEFRACNVKWHSFSEQVIFLFQLLSANLDLVHFPYFSWPVFYFKPFVATIHDTILLKHSTGKASNLPYFIYKIKQTVFRYVFGQQVYRAKKIFVPSNAVKDELVSYYPYSVSKIIVTTEGVDKLFTAIEPEKPREIERDEKFYIYVGNCYPHKNVDSLLKAFSKYRMETRRRSTEYAKLVIVGPESMFAQNLKKEFSHLEDDVLWLHNIKTSELKWLYSQSLSLVFPSKAEGFGLPIVEAMSVGCPLILSDIPVFHEVAGENATYFGVGDAEGLVTELSKVERSANAVGANMSFTDLAITTLETYQNI